MARKTNNSITVFEKQKYRQAFTFVLTGRGWMCCIMSAGRCPGLWKTLGFQPVVACVLKSLTPYGS